MVIGAAVSEEDRQPLAVDDGLIECVNHFSYLRSVIVTENNLDTEIDVRIAKASKTSGALQNSVFCDHHLSVPIKQHVYWACVFSTLLYGSEHWAPLHCHLRKLDDLSQLH